jgi:hypothetical protein
MTEAMMTKRKYDEEEESFEDILCRQICEDDEARLRKICLSCGLYKNDCSCERSDD